MKGNKFTEIRRILVLILLLNWLVAFTKIIYGLITKCASMTADGVHSFGDGASNIIGLVGIWVASKPKDKDHPYGHKKFETFATLGIAAILFFASLNILKEAVFRVFNPVLPDVTALSFILMLSTLAVNIFVMKYEYGKGKELHSDILVCDSIHTKTDIFASIVVIGTLISLKFGLSVLDTIVAGFIALLIAKSGFSILKESSIILCDANVVSDKKISSIVRVISGIYGIHNIRTRGRQDDIHVDLHVVIDPSMHVDHAHELSHKIESVLKKKIPGITDVSVHMEPIK